MRRRRGFVFACLSVLFAAALAGAADARTAGWCGKARRGAQDAVWAHREALQQRERGGAVAAQESGRAATVVGQVAVVEDRGDLALGANRLDLQNAGLLFAPAGGGYRLDRVDRPVDADTGTPLLLGDDATRAVDLPFTFSFYGRSYSRVFVNSDGNLSFGEGDAASTARSLGRFLSGPPRIAALFADLDPSAGGSVRTRSLADRFSVVWSRVPQFDETDENTFEVTLRADGAVEMAYGSVNGALAEGVVGVAPGADAGGLVAADVSAGGVSGAGAIAESFRAEATIDLVAVARRFYSEFPDEFFQLVVFTTERLVPRGVFAYEQTVRNAGTGFGVGAFDVAAAYGSSGALESVLLMDNIAKYPDDLAARFLGEDSALGVLAHETGHRWLAQARYRDGEVSMGDLLGRDEVHWSFFMNSEASHLEGNAIEDQGGGRFRTVAAGERYSPLDQYLMGLRPPAEVPPFFVVRSPTGTADTSPGRDPQTGVSFGGTRRDVSIEAVVAAMGPRQPAFGEAPNRFRQAFVLVSVGGPPAAALAEEVERFRQAWEPYFARSTEGRATVETRLQ